MSEIEKVKPEEKQDTEDVIEKCESVYDNIETTDINDFPTLEKLFNEGDKLGCFVAPVKKE